MKTHERSRAIRLAPDEPPRRSWVHPRPGDGHVARRAGRHARAGAPLAGAEQRARRAIVADQRRRPRFQCAAGGDPPAAATPRRRAGPARSGVFMARIGAARSGGKAGRLARAARARSAVRDDRGARRHARPGGADQEHLSALFRFRPLCRPRWLARDPLSRRNAIPGRGSVLRSGGARAFRGTLQPAGRGTHTRYLLAGTAARGGGRNHGAVSARLAGRLAAALRWNRSPDRELASVEFLKSAHKDAVDSGGKRPRPELSTQGKDKICGAVPTVNRLPNKTVGRTALRALLPTLRSFSLLQIGAEDRHLKIVRALLVLVVHEQNADELLADVDLGGILLLRPRHHPDAGVAEQALEVRFDLTDFLNVHRCLPPQPPDPAHRSSKIWSMKRAGSGQPASPMTFAGTPATVFCAGTAWSTPEPAAMRAQQPTSMLPRIFAPAPIITPRRIFGWRSPSCLPVPPRVTPWSMETSSSMTAVSPTTRPVA